MTRRPQLTSTLLDHVSVGALTVGVWVSPKENNTGSEARLGLLARFGMWLRLIFGFGGDPDRLEAVPEPHYHLSRHQQRAAARRRKRQVSGRKCPAHDLEMLMRFAPGARRGLTLNQYRERFTRLAVIGRMAIYFGYFNRRFQRRAGADPHAQDSLSPRSEIALCQAPLHPD
jgi:hypothetical protein